MSKIGKQEIKIPAGTEITWNYNSVTVKGPKGELTKKLRLDGFVLSVDKGAFKVIPPTQLDKRAHSMWGTLTSVIGSMLKGIAVPFSKVLEFEGIGYKAEVAGNEVILNMGFSHPVKVKILEGITVAVQKNQITVSGVDKDKVGLFAARIRKVRKIEPYKLTGIKYQGEVVKKKAGKKLAGSGA